VVLYRYADRQPRKYDTDLDQAHLVFYLKPTTIATNATEASDEESRQWEELGEEAEPAKVYYTSDNCYMVRSEVCWGGGAVSSDTIHGVAHTYTH